MKLRILWSLPLVRCMVPFADCGNAKTAMCADMVAGKTFVEVMDGVEGVYATKLAFGADDTLAYTASSLRKMRGTREHATAMPSMKKSSMCT